MTSSDAAMVDLLVVACPICQGAAAAPVALVGRPVRCPLCAAGYVVPVPPAEPCSAGASEPPNPAVLFPDAVDGSVAAALDPTLPVAVGAAASLADRAKTAARDRRRSQRSLVLAVVGAAILAVLVYLLGAR